jgi:hypothetical protein
LQGRRNALNAAVALVFHGESLKERDLKNLEFPALYTKAVESKLRERQ